MGNAELMHECFPKHSSVGSFYLHQGGDFLPTPRRGSHVTSDTHTHNHQHTTPLSQYTWSGFEAAKTAPWPSRGLHHFGKFLEPSDE